MQEGTGLSLSGGFTPCRHPRPYSRREHTLFSPVIMIIGLLDE